MLPQLSTPRWLLLIAGLLLLGSCQRATYSFQRASSQLVAAAPDVRPDALAAILPIAKHALSLPLPKVPHKHRVDASARSQRSRPVVAAGAQPPLPAAVAVGQLRRLAAAAAPAAPGSDPPIRHRTKAIAVLLAVLGISYLPLSLHNFYLGYPGRGIAAIGLLAFGLLLLLLGAPATFLFGSLTVVGYIGIGVLAGWFIWQLSDLARIITGDLKPANGEYYPRFFQTRPAKETSAR